MSAKLLVSFILGVASMTVVIAFSAVLPRGRMGRSARRGQPWTAALGPAAVMLVFALVIGLPGVVAGGKDGAAMTSSTDVDAVVAIVKANTGVDEATAETAVSQAGSLIVATTVEQTSVGNPEEDSANIRAVLAAGTPQRLDERRPVAHPDRR